MNSSFLLLLVILLLTVGSVINKTVVGRAHPFTVQYMQSTVNLVLLPVWFYLSKKFAPQDGFDRTTYFYSVVGCIISGLGFVLFLSALKDKPLSVAVSYLSTYPALTLMLCAFLGMEKITIPRTIGIVFILMGVVLIQLFDK